MAARFRALSDDYLSSDLESPASFDHVNDLDDQPSIRRVDGTGKYLRIAK